MPNFEEANPAEPRLDTVTMIAIRIQLTEEQTSPSATQRSSYNRSLGQQDHV